LIDSKTTKSAECTRNELNFLFALFGSFADFALSRNRWLSIVSRATPERYPECGTARVAE
jgi:hypothetical protein